MESAVQPGCPPDLSQPLILVADDEPFILKYIERVLQVANYRVITTTTMEDAWKILERHQSEIELVLTDIVMPGRIDGLELAEKIHQLAPGLPVLFVTGALCESDPRAALMTEKQLVLRKPFFPKQLVEFVGAQIDRERSSRVAP
jgi:two-component system, cell cycle sensor histidine kinase and response regulator CckA